tara:strand:+ start:320 stop:676 length:357 start_codon:yes stop_codon:yes gene_type:complete
MSFKSKLTEFNDEYEYEYEYDEKYDYEYIPTPITTCTKKCTIPNYIPHPTPRNNNREYWHSIHNTYLIEMFNIVIDILENELPKYKIVRDNDTFNKFSLLIYNSSSKYISPYLHEYTI